MSKRLKISYLILLLALFVGLVDSSFLLYKYLSADSVNCFLFEGCNTVAKSPFAKPFGIPLPLFGVIFYFGMIILSLLTIKFANSTLRNLLILGALIGFLMSLYFVYLQGFVIMAFCIYCLISAVDSVIAFCAVIYMRNIQTSPQRSEEKPTISI